MIRKYKPKEELDFLMKNYSIAENRAQQYFTYMYNIMNFTFVYFAALFALIHYMNPSKEQNKMIIKIIMCYLLPIVFYILGLFYTYNSLALYKVGNDKMKLEYQIILIAKANHFKNSISLWDVSAKTSSIAYIVTYGTMLAFYIFIPPTSIFIYSYYIESFICVLMSLKLPVLFELIFLVFEFIIIKQIVKEKRKCTKLAKKINHKIKCLEGQYNE